MDIQEKLQEINEYIEKKILKGDFEFISIDDREISHDIKIDGITVSLWTYSNCENLQIMTIGEGYTFKKHSEVRNIVKPVIDKHIKENIIKEKEAELKKLKSDLS